MEDEDTLKESLELAIECLEHRADEMRGCCEITTCDCINAAIVIRNLISKITHE